MKKREEELKKYLLENYINKYGELDLSNLDFSDFEGDILISNWKVKKNLDQSHQKVGGCLEQDYQIVGTDLCQSHQSVICDLYQSHQNVEKNLEQYKQSVGGNLYQSEQTVKGCIEAYKPKKSETVETKKDHLLIKFGNDKKKKPQD